jgi:type VI protein secretion system component VasF
MNSITAHKIDKFISKKCLKIMAFVQMVLMLVVAFVFLGLSFQVGENETLKMLGGDSRFDKTA